MAGFLCKEISATLIAAKLKSVPIIFGAKAFLSVLDNRGLVQRSVSQLRADMFLYKLPSLKGTMIQNLKEELKKLPDKPGVYIMRDADDTILYVGKAVNLSNRVRSYFRENIGRGPKIDKMVSLVERYEYKH